MGGASVRLRAGRHPPAHKAVVGHPGLSRPCVAVGLKAGPLEAPRLCRRGTLPAPMRSAICIYLCRPATQRTSTELSCVMVYGISACVSLLVFFNEYKQLSKK